MVGRGLLNPQAAEHLARLLGMTGSDHDGEVFNAARLADRFVRQLGLTWFDVIFISPPWQHMAKVCRKHSHLLTAHEADFINTISRQRRMPTDKQLAWLEAIHDRIRIGGAK